MHWLYLATLPPALWAVGNHIDKYLIEKRLHGVGVGPLLIYSSLVGLLPLISIVAIDGSALAVSFGHAVVMIFNGALYVIGLVPYLEALEREETSVVVSLFQVTAVFSYLLGLMILDEQLSVAQIGACLLVVSGSVLISWDFTYRHSLKRGVFILMLAASLFNAVNWLLFKVVALDESFIATSFWEYTGFVVVAIGLLLFHPTYRAQFLSVTRAGGAFFAGISTLNEVLSLCAKVATNLATLAAPLALVSTVNSLQPLFAFLFAIVLTVFFPRVGRERLRANVLLQKAAAIGLILAGSAVLAFHQ